MTVFLVLPTSAIGTPENQLKKLTLATPVTVSNPYFKWLREIYRSALNQLGYRLVIRQCEPMLCTQLANLGKVDGELTRYAGYQSLVPTLIRVSESPFDTAWSAFTIDKNLKIENWQQIHDSQLTIGYLAGLPYLAQNLITEKAESRVTKVRHWRVGVNHLKTGKIDLYIGADALVTPFLSVPEYSQIYRAGVISSIPLYAYLNQKHGQLAIKLSAIIAEMKSNGRIEELFQLTVSPQHLYQ